MIHHQRMNSSALDLLDLLLGIIKNHRKLFPVHFADLPIDNQVSPNSLPK
jgi:hypothetical protein